MVKLQVHGSAALFSAWNKNCIHVPNQVFAISVSQLKPNMTDGINHICLAEDDADDYYIFSKLLNELNGAVKLTWFQTCEDLLHFLKAGNNLPDLIALDMNMPKMDGHSCLVSIKKELELLHIPVIILSTSNHESTVTKCYQSGAFKYFQKPDTLDEYRKIINEMLVITPTALHKS